MLSIHQLPLLCCQIQPTLTSAIINCHNMPAEDHYKSKSTTSAVFRFIILWQFKYNQFSIKKLYSTCLNSSIISIVNLLSLHGLFFFLGKQGEGAGGVLTPVPKHHKSCRNHQISLEPMPQRNTLSVQSACHFVFLSKECLLKLFTGFSPNYTDQLYINQWRGFDLWSTKGQLNL